MTQSITIPQSAIDELRAGTHTLTIEAVSDNGFSASQSQEFVTWNVPHMVVPELGEYNTGFSFDIEISNLNGRCTVIGELDDSPFYQLNYANEGIYSIRLSESLVLALSSGTHTLVFNLVDEQGKTATGTTSFVRTPSFPAVSVVTNLGDRKAAFSVNYTIKNVQSERPTLDAYMDSRDNPFISYPDASISTNFTVNNNVFNALDNGSHTIIIDVTNAVGTTTKNVSFNKVSHTENITGLKLGYKDDTWDKTVLEDRIFEERQVDYDGQLYMSFEDKTPYDTEGEVVTGSLLASMSRGIQNALPSNVVTDASGVMTETSANGVSVLTETQDGYIEVITDSEGNTLTKTVFFNNDGTIAESTSFVRSGQ